MKRSIAYIGFGDLGRQLSLLIKQCSNAELTEIFFDDNLAAAGKPNAYPFAAYLDDRFDGYEFFICIGYKHLPLKTTILAALQAAGRKPGSFIHPTAFINPTAVIGSGVIIYPCCNVDQYVALHDGVFLNNSVTISHHSIIGKSTFMAPGVTVCGNVTIGAENFTGSGSVISNNVTVGDGVVTVIGNPMKMTAKKINLR
jgi:acetyltransferase-like isoleucine patch superfamily enzyme